MRIWSLSNNTAGMRAQALGLARALGGILDAEVAEKILPLGRGLSGVSPPDVVVACGASAVFPALDLKRRFGAYAVFVQRPFFGESWFDAVVRPRHDGPGGKNSLAITGATGLVSAGVLSARRSLALARFDGESPRIGVLFGGGNRAHSLSPADCVGIRESVLRARARVGGTILATASRRTGAENIRVLGDFLWEDGGGNPYLDILAAADILAVTGDSVNMLSEACASGCPALIFRPSLRSGWRARRAAAKFAAFHRELESLGVARFWRGDGGDLMDWEKRTSPGLDETARAAKWLAEKIRAR